MSILIPDPRKGPATLAQFVRALRERARSNPDSRMIYIAGPITGLPDRNERAIGDAEQDLRMRGLRPINPLRLNPIPWTTWGEAMRVDIAHLVVCDMVALLPGWEASLGVTVEMQIAHALQLDVRSLDAWLTLPVLRHLERKGAA